MFKLRFTFYLVTALSVLLVAFVAEGQGSRMPSLESSKPVGIPIEDLRPWQGGQYSASAFAYKHFIRGVLESRNGEIAAAIREFRLALLHDDKSPAIHAALAHELARSGMMEEAEKHCHQALELDEGYVKALEVLSRIYIATGRMKDAVQTLERITKLDIDKMSAFDLLAALYLSEKQEDKAIQTYERLSLLHPENIEAGFKLGSLFWRQGETDKAETQFMDILHRYPDDEKTLIMLAVLYEQREMFPKAKEMYERIVELLPDDTRIQLALIKLAIRQNDASALATHKKRFYELASNDSRMLMQLPKLFYDERKYKWAEDECRAILAATPDVEAAYFYLALALQKQKKYVEAEEVLKNVKTDSQFSIRAHLFRTELLTDQKRFDEAQAFLGALLEKYKDSSEITDVISSYVSVLKEAGKNSEAEAFLKKQIETQPERYKEDLLYALGNLYEMLKKRNEAIETMQKVILFNPQNAGALNYIGYTLAEDGEKLDEAEAYIQRAIAVEPDDGYITDSLGWVYYKQGKTKRALEVLQRANVLSPWTSEVLYHMAVVYYANGEVDKARRSLQQAIECEPDEELSAKIKAFSETLNKPNNSK